MIYKESVSDDFLSIIPKEAHTIVEIGCNTGRLAEMYRTINPNVRYLAVELSEEAARKAATRIECVITGDIEKPEVFSELEKNLDENKIDVLILSDVLEHLIDPWGILIKFRKIMSSNGCCVVCIPNVSHWTILAGLIHGEWNYSDFGLLDRTHLRFFTKKTMIELFQNTGWQVEISTPRIFAPDETEQAMSVFTSLASPFGLTPEQVKENLSVFQWVIRAQCV
ncbi:MAG: class I SAM-dependent methyltransferase [Methylococcales bacterium]|jgi:2-polyprenyl-3-methyl-5-hydroxy-6-metoxy-1,4-benzoquinol methylase|nr:class I SAM-dependent methyltransferase [Methylococcales bacterium]